MRRNCALPSESGFIDRVTECKYSQVGRRSSAGFRVCAQLRRQFWSFVSSVRFVCIDAYFALPAVDAAFQKAVDAGSTVLDTFWVTDMVRTLIRLVLNGDVTPKTFPKKK
jgi:hypothetical protein